jgi:hypothetical protein
MDRTEEYLYAWAAECALSLAWCLDLNHKVVSRNRAVEMVLSLLKDHPRKARASLRRQLEDGITVATFCAVEVLFTQIVLRLKEDPVTFQREWDLVRSGNVIDIGRYKECGLRDLRAERTLAVVSLDVD